MPPDSDNSDHYETFVALFARHEGDLRAFTRSLLPSWEDVDEVMQRTALALWRKFAQFDLNTVFMKWACVVARFEVLAYRRKMARDRLVFSESIMELLADEAQAEAEVSQAAALGSREQRALDACLEKLPEAKRELVMLAYTPGVQITDIAAKQGRRPNTLYMTLNRIRQDLMHCMEASLKQEEHA
ncbi:MAG: sigma-70 family RNA polymerase sigma factor [Bacteroidetes bacterium]|jgi:RNA polymerase sigma-70 factor (ECF subfamily)|uniref:sigma-70 family RNA polymerase sigma factor n=1 Tax=Prosthecobacter sp. TaxID=1965333 RepID=UPI003784B4EB|nr:sigma-70 family RNA polymerase sigma factor [Bacteroidota bacterium]